MIMTRYDIMTYESCNTTIKITDQFKRECGIEPDEKFKITKVIGSFDLVEITNQYGQKHTTNPRNLIAPTH